MSLGLVGLKSFVNDLEVIIASVARLSSFEQSFDHLLFTAFEVKNERAIHQLSCFVSPRSEVLEVSWESVDEEISGILLTSFHGSLKQANRDVAGDYLTV